MVAMPIAVRTAAAWSWRVIVIAAAVVGIGYVLATFTELVIPVFVALLLTALLGRPVHWLTRWIPRGLATAVVLLGSVVLILGGLTVVVQQITTSSGTIVNQLKVAIGQIHQWLLNGPFKISEAQINSVYNRAVKFLSSGSDQIASGALAVGTTLTHVLAGVALTLFATFFFLYQGRDIWGWFVRLSPRTARMPVDNAARRGWLSLTAYVRATILVAFTDAVGITAVALILRVPLAPAIGVLVFLGAFIPIIGALLSGIVAILLALVAHGPVVALIMTGGVLGVQQLESHVLQPFLMGRLVRLHPLAILFSLAAGTVLAGLLGALFAVPVVAFVNAFVNHLSSGEAFDAPPPPTDPATADKDSPDGEPASEPTEGSVAEPETTSIDASPPSQSSDSRPTSV